MMYMKKKKKKIDMHDDEKPRKWSLKKSTESHENGSVKVDIENNIEEIDIWKE